MEFYEKEILRKYVDFERLFGLVRDTGLFESLIKCKIIRFSI